MACLFFFFFLPPSLFAHLIKFAWPTRWLSCGAIWQKAFSREMFWPAAVAAGAMVVVVVCQGDTHEVCVCVCVRERESEIASESTRPSAHHNQICLIEKLWPSHLSAITTGTSICHVTVKPVPPIWLIVAWEGRGGEGGLVECWCAERSRWMGFDVLLLGYISMKRGGVATCCRACWSQLCECAYVWWRRRTGAFLFFFFWEAGQGSALTGSRSRLTVMAREAEGEEGGGVGLNVPEVFFFFFLFFFKESMFTAQRDWWMVVLGPSPRLSWSNGPGRRTTLPLCYCCSAHYCCSVQSDRGVVTAFFYLSQAHFVAGRRN